MKLYFGFFVSTESIGCGWTENSYDNQDSYDNQIDALLAMYNQENADPYTDILGVIAFDLESKTLELSTADEIEENQPVSQCANCDLWFAGNPDNNDYCPECAATKFDRQAIELEEQREAAKYG
jgi:hypothetical protein